ncbi:MBL fold metallo-hydrolase [Sphingomonas sp. BIUV-7]|uniref:MBL fold metallo-hydrolase n=1 Tax=Sphingomonas natans TaxID=3063330 RepID=A0ABT8Y9J4_9SPHN|nr:MBL fold metallo-hydrolase [Sphingomonas sp. BIUV-7]MDO6415008.1 MBL fold metallo-hydrolase [Sphingomonas sp. BIUV-7]
MKRASLATVAGVALAVLASPASLAQEAGRAPRAAADYPAPTAFPKANEAAVATHLSAARKIAGADLFADMAHRCIISPVYPVRVRGIQYDGKITPTKVFDQFYSVGQNAVSAYVLKTSAGLILFDTLDNADEAEHLLVPNMIALGLDPKQIKYIVLTHGHGDHYGGADWLQRTTGAKVIAAAADWAMMEKGSASGPFKDLVTPKRDMVIADGQTLTLGDTSIRFYVTPGHTPGTLSAIFAVTDHGQKHIVGFNGGTGGGRDEAGLRASIPAFGRWAELTKAAGVDTLIANHPLHAETLEREELIRHALPGDPNPFVIGADTYQRYVRVQQECARVQLARMGLTE